MKKTALLLLVLSVFACSKNKVNYTVVSGSFSNVNDRNLSIKGIDTTFKLNVNPDGTFADTLYLAYDGKYEFLRKEIYLENGKNLIINVDLDNTGEIVFEGDLAPENIYIKNKTLLNKEVIGNMKDFLSLDEEKFLNKVTEFETKAKSLLESQSFSVNNYKLNELKNLEYGKSYLYLMYEENHGFLAEKENFKVSKKFPSIPNIDFDNSADYNFSIAYRNLVEGNVYKSLPEENYQKELLARFNAIKSENIKAGLAKGIAYEITPSNPLSEEFFKAVEASLTDKVFLEDLRSNFDKLKKIVPGNESPKFKYENYNGGETSLEDFKGKYVYIDVWATWCGPCKNEIPYLIELEKIYHDKNIVFVSISVDDRKDYQLWKDFVKEHNLVGVQLFADNSWKSDFINDYVINSIPRFILIDTEGKIISADAPRPSSKDLVSKFTELGL